MKKIIVLIIFWTGDLVSKLMYIPGFHGMYGTYNYLMSKSSDLQDKWGLDGPWKKVGENTNE